MFPASMRIAIIGAGPAGLAAGWRLAKAGVIADIYEAGPAIGGLAKSVDVFGRRVDLGSHIFTSPDARVHAAWDEAIGDQWKEVAVRRGILCETGTVVDYPIRPLKLPAAIGMMETVRCVAGFACANLWPRKCANSARDVIVQRYGQPLFEAFFRSYGEKYLGIPSEQVDPAFAYSVAGGSRTDAGGRLSSLKRRLFGEEIKNRGGQDAYNPDVFRWPKRGSGEIWLGLEKIIQASGSRIRLRTSVTGIDAEGGRVRSIETDAGTVPCDHVISSMPLPLLCKILRGPFSFPADPANGLKMRSTVLVYLLIKVDRPMKYSWVYVYTPRQLVGRITNFGMWVGIDREETLLSFEYWCMEGDSLWARSDDDLVALATEELEGCGVYPGAAVLRGSVLRVKGTHPSFEAGYQERTDAVWEQLDKIQGLHSVGRHGRLDLSTTGSSMRMGIDAAEKILANG
jgi:protoporphyrinogen oxidase